MQTGADSKWAGEKTSSPTASITVKWSMVAFACGMVAIASLSTLIVVTAVTDIDTLSTVALVLAILAFVIQIIIFIAQSWTSGQQMLQSETINADTRALLSELREGMRNTHELLGRHYDKVLEKLLLVADKTVAETIKDADVETLRERLHAELSDVIRSEVGSARVVEPALQPRASQRSMFESDDSNRPDAVEMRTLPRDSDQIRKALDELVALPSSALGSLYRLGRDIIGSRELGGYVGVMPARTDEYDLLAQRGLIGEISDYDKDMASPEEELITLSAKGRSLARLLTADDAGPTEFSEQLAVLRDTAVNEWQKWRRRRRPVRRLQG